jgi:hypothetical protein
MDHAADAWNRLVMAERVVEVDPDNNENCPYAREETYYAGDADVHCAEPNGPDYCGSGARPCPLRDGPIVIRARKE